MLENEEKPFINILDLKDRIRQVRLYFNIKNQKELAELLDVQAQKIADLESGRVSNIKVEEAIKFEVILKVNPWWLMSGQGEMLIKNSKIIQAQYAEKQICVKLLLPTLNNQIDIILDQTFLSNYIKSSSVLRALQIIGDSMSPTLNNGDFAIIDITKNAPLDGLYAIMQEEEIFIKRLNFLLDDTVQIMSDNPIYKTKTYPKNSINILGLVILQIKNY